VAAKVICMASAKGGSGKTVLTASFGTFLSLIGKRVLLIDTDAATNGLSLMHLKEVRRQAERAYGIGNQPRGVYEDVAEDHPAELTTLSCGLSLIPATYRFINTEDVAPPDFEESLRNALKQCREDFDYIFLDAQAGADSFAKVSMTRGISDEVVIVSEFDPVSAAGVERLKGLLPKVLYFDRTWVLLNKLLPEFVRSFSDFLEVARYASPIPWDAEIVKAYAQRRLALDLEKGNTFTLGVMETLKSLFRDEIGPTLDKWLEDRVSGLRDPVAVQYQNTKKELEGIAISRRKIERGMKWRVLIGVTFHSCLIMCIGLVVFLPQFHDLVRFMLILAAIFLLGVIGYHVSPEGAFGVEVTELWARIFGPRMSDSAAARARISREEQEIKDRIVKLEAFLKLEADALFKLGATKEAVDLVTSGWPG
jgi:cellulose biosynthesis protein BcsQ